MPVAPLPLRARLGLATIPVLALLVIATPIGAARPAAAAVYSAGGTETVEARDDFFDPEAIHVAPGVPEIAATICSSEIFPCFAS